jgi:hypothetical protein
MVKGIIKRYYNGNQSPEPTPETSFISKYNLVRQWTVFNIVVAVVVVVVGLKARQLLQVFAPNWRDD